MSDFIAYLSLEDFIHYVVPNDDHQVRVEAIERTRGDNIQWLIIITSKTYGGIALMSLLVGQVWKFAAADEPWHRDNANEAVWMIRKYLGQAGFTTAPGVWNPNEALDNIVYGSAGLWHFEKDYRLVANEEQPEE